MSIRPALRTLLQPARADLVLRHLGQLALVLAALVCVPTLFALASGEDALATSLAAAALAPLALVSLCALIPARGRTLQPNESLVIASLAFLLAAVAMTGPLAASGMAPLDAWFEAVSGVTTTGLSMLQDPGSRGDAFLFTRAWMQWFGGLGILVLALALAAGSPADMRRLAGAASDEDGLAEGTRVHARRVLAVYCSLTLLGILLVWAAGLAPVAAVIHTLSAISTGGFSGYSDSLAGLDRQAQLALLTIALVGALPLPLIYRAWRDGPRRLLRDPEPRALLAAVALVSLALWLLAGVAPADALMQGLTAQTGCGFSTLDPAALDPSAKLVLIVSMLTGGGIGSTAGGIKLVRVLILIRLIQLAILRVQVPRHAVLGTELGGRALDCCQVERAMVLLLLFPLVVLVSWLPFVVAGYEPLDALFEVTSAVGTVGLSVGITSPDLAPGLKLLLGVDMLLGRVEILALLVLIYPRTWFKTRREVK